MVEGGVSSEAAPVAGTSISTALACVRPDGIIANGCQAKIEDCCCSDDGVPATQIVAHSVYGGLHPPGDVLPLQETTSAQQWPRQHIGESNTKRTQSEALGEPSSCGHRVCAEMWACAGVVGVRGCSETAATCPTRSICTIRNGEIYIIKDGRTHRRTG